MKKKKMINEEKNKNKKKFRGLVVFAINEKKKKKNPTGLVLFVINARKKQKK